MFTVLLSYLQAFLVPRLIIILVPDKAKTQKKKISFVFRLDMCYGLGTVFFSRVYVLEAWPSGWRC